jgi:hypothetical protein
LANASDLKTNAECLIEIQAPVGKRLVVHGVQWSYSAAPTAEGTLSIFRYDGAAEYTLLQSFILAGGPGSFSLALVGNDGDVVSVVLSAGGTSIQGSLNAQFTLE